MKPVSNCVACGTEYAAKFGSIGYCSEECEDGIEDSYRADVLGWQLYREPKVPLTLDCEVEWKITSKGLIYPDSTNGKFYESVGQFIGKRTRMVLTEILEDENGGS